MTTRSSTQPTVTHLIDSRHFSVTFIKFRAPYFAFSRRTSRPGGESYLVSVLNSPTRHLASKVSSGLTKKKKYQSRESFKFRTNNTITRNAVPASYSRRPFIIVVVIVIILYSVRTVFGFLDGGFVSAKREKLATNVYARFGHGPLFIFENVSRTISIPFIFVVIFVCPYARSAKSEG